MSIKTVGQFQELINNYRATDWAKSAKFDEVFNGISDKLETTTTDNRKSFSEMLSSQISGVNNLQKEADVAIQKLVTGKTKNVHETMLAVEKAEIAFKMMNQIRTKVIDAYRETMRMQI
jgi:flagellar hook-basal body complex protein FliE